MEMARTLNHFLIGRKRQTTQKMVITKKKHFQAENPALTVSEGGSHFILKMLR